MYTYNTALFFIIFFLFLFFFFCFKQFGHNAPLI